MAQYKIEALWDCVYCGTKAIGGSKGVCPNCGNPRGAEVRFYLPSDIGAEHAVDETKQPIGEEPDWLCRHCQRYNRAGNRICHFCGAERNRENEDYFQIGRREREKNGEEA